MSKRLLITVVLAAVTFRLIVALAGFAVDGTDWFTRPDTTTYVSGATAIREHQGFTLVDLDGTRFPITRRTPGYPLFLALWTTLFGSRWLWATVLIQSLLDAALIVLIVDLGWKVGLGHLGLLAAAVYYALDINSARYASVILSESLFTALLLSAVWYLYHEWSRPPASGPGSRVQQLLTGAICGALFGAASLVRPIGLFPALGFLGCLVVACWVPPIGTLHTGQWGQRLQDSFSVLATALLVFGIVTGAWIVRNGIEANYWSITSVDYINLFYYRAIGADAQQAGVEPETIIREFQRPGSRDTITERERLARGKVLKNDAYRIILSHPLAYGIVAAKGAGPLMLGWLRHDWGQLLGERIGTDVSLLGNGLMVLVWLLVLVGVAKRPAGLPIAILVAFTIIVTAGPEVDSRFRVPIEPFIALGFGAGLEASWPSLRRLFAAFRS